MIAKIVVVANMKGGVGKTTIATGLAECSSYLGRNTLAIDLDLQSNLSTTLLGLDGEDAPDDRDPWTHKQTVVDLLKAHQNGGTPKPQAYLQHISDNLKLLAGHTEIVDYERRLISQRGNLHAAKLTALAGVQWILRELRPMFDLIIFDMPPGLSITAESAISEADIIVLPQAPDRLSSQGLPVYQRYLENNVGIPRLGERTHVLINMVPPNLTTVARTRIKAIRDKRRHPDFPYDVFNTQLTQLVGYREAMARKRPGRFNNLWTGVDHEMIAACRELWDFLDQPLSLDRRSA